MYKSQPMVYATVNKLVYGISRLPINIYEFNEAGDSRQQVKNHELARLLRRPYPRGSAFSLKAHIALSLHLHGNALVLKSRDNGPGSPPTELWPVPWKSVQVIEDERGPVGYQISIGIEQYYVGPEDVIHYELPGGISPLAPLRRTLALEDAAMTWQGESLRNGVTPRGAFVTDQRIDQNALPALRTELEKLYGGAENAGRFGIFDKGMKWEAMGHSAVDAELLGQRKLSREEVCAALDVPPPLVGILDNASLNNVIELRKALFDAIASKLVLIEEATQAQLIDGEPAWDGLYNEFDTTELVRPDPEVRARTYLMEQQSSTTTINERRMTAGYPRIDDPAADTVFAPMNMTPVGQAPLAAAPIEGNPGGTPEQGQTDPNLLTR
jgi:HK97 family phage portal protein